MNDVLELVSLQSLDDDLDRMRARLAAAEEQLAGNEELAQLRSRLKVVDDTLAGLRTRQRGAEATIEDLGARIEREEKTLYDGSIKQFKELQALEGDVSHVRDERRTAEDGMLEILSDLESAEGERAQLVADVAKLEAEWERFASTLTIETRELRKQIAAAEKARTARVALVSASSLRLYNALRVRKGGRAVALVQGAACGGCRVTLPDSLRRKIFNSPTLVTCPQCERILSAG